MKKFTRFLSVLLCVLMVVSLMPWGTVSAAKPERRTPVQPKFGKNYMSRTIGTVEGYTYFETFEELVQLAAETYSEPTPILYLGSGTLKITDNLGLPENLILLAPDIEVASGVEFLAPYLFADSLVVNGTAFVVYAEVESNIDINGTYYNYYQLHLLGETVRDGLQNIIHLDDAVGCIWYYPATLAELKTAAADAEAGVGDGMDYSIDFESDVTISENIKLPRNCTVYLTDVNVTVSSGVTLTMNGYLWLNGSLNIDGELVLDGVIDLYYDEGGLLSFGENACCSGEGPVYVTASAISDPFEATPGLKNYTAEYDADYECWVLLHSVEEQRLTGDFDNNGVVDDADVAYLLWHILFADEYPLDISGDINADGAVDDEDVGYLLWHTLFPDSYPL